MQRLSQTEAIRAESAIAAERRAFARSTARSQPRAAVLDVAGGCAVYTGDGLFSNRAFALGLTEPFEPLHLDLIEDFYRTRDAAPRLEVASVADPALIGLLRTRRYGLSRFRNIFVHLLDGVAASSGPPGLEVDIVISDNADGDNADSDNASAWSDTLVDGFGYTEPADIARVEEWNDALLATPGLTALVAVIGSETVGSASVLIQGAVAVLGGATTRLPYRRRGIQTALIAARLRLAGRAGCELAVVTADPGSSSARNSERAGFHLACTHAVMGRSS